jgi:RNA polymerase sigma-70 factor (ECF subfamily)
VARDLHTIKRDRSLGSFKGWLRNITRWRIMDQLRKRTKVQSEDESSRTEHPQPNPEEIPDPAAAEAESIWEQEWQENLLKAAMERVKRKVKEEHYQMFDLYVIKHWPVTKVAQTLGVNIGQVYLAKHRLSALIRKEVRALEEQWH